MAMALILCAMAIPQVNAGLERSRTAVAARYLAAEMALARAQAVKRSANVAIRFGDRASGFEMSVFVDGNRNGVRVRDIVAGIDRRIRPAERLEQKFPGVTINVAPESGVDGGPVRFGQSDLLSFSSVGTATPGSVYVLGRDGSQFVVRVVGATARTRVLRFIPAKRIWTDS